MRRSFRDGFQLCRAALSRNRLRSALSVVGVVLGIAAVTSMLSVGLGAREQILQQVDRLGLRNIIVRSDFDLGAGGRGLVLRDVWRLRELLPKVNIVTPVVSRYQQVVGPARTQRVTVVGVETAYGPLMRLVVDNGRSLSIPDENEARRVCVLGAMVARSAFGYRDPVGETIRLQNETYRVVGVLRAQTTSSNSVGPIAPRNFNETVLVPLAAILGGSSARDGEQTVEEVWIQAQDEEDLGILARLIGRSLSWTRRGRDYEVIVPAELLAQRFETQQTFAVVIGSIALVSLVVGGIGIMNVMLASVVERTSEIGLRRTVGATQRDIAGQFLGESVVLTTLGGLLGVAGGTAASWAIAAYAGWPVQVSVLALLLAVGIAGVVGVVFGTYPAIRAARLQPIDAVRHE